MEMSFGVALLGVATLICLITTVTAFARPVEFANLLGLDIANAGGVNEIRSQYAGFFLMVGLVFAAAIGGWVPRAAAYFLASVIFGGLLIGRIVSVTLNRGVGGYPVVVRGLVAFDLMACILSVTALEMTPGTIA
ncbi:MAG: DUF4345 family protein [Sphingomonas sp.]